MTIAWRCWKNTGRAYHDGMISSMSQKTLFGTQVSNTDRPYYPVDSRVSRSVVPDSAKARRMTVTSGRKCLGWCRSSGPLGLLEKMLLDSSAWHSTMCVLTWSVRVTPAGRSYFQLRASVPHTCEIESSWWPTMTVADAYGHGYTYDQGDPSKPRLTLAGKARLYPTPCAQDAKNATLPPSQRERDTVPGVLIREGASGALNPTWVEWLQGFPPEWTNLGLIDIAMECHTPETGPRDSGVSGTQ